MQLSQLMSTKLINVRPDDSLEYAVKQLRRRGVRHLLVMDGSKLVGILSDRDIKKAMAPAKAKQRLQAVGGLYFLVEPIQVEEIMTRDPVFARPGTSAQEAALLMLRQRFGALPIVDRQKVVGIITETDLLRYFANKEARSLRKATAPKRHRSQRRKQRQRY